MTPTATIIASAAATEIVIDADGRRLTIRRLSALDRLRLFKAAGPMLAHNQPWLGMALIASSVAAIDDLPTAYVCRGYVCDRPVTDAAALLEQLDGAAKSGAVVTASTGG